MEIFVISSKIIIGLCTVICGRKNFADMEGRHLAKVVRSIWRNFWNYRTEYLTVIAPLSRKKPSETDQFVSADKSEIRIKR